MLFCSRQYLLFFLAVFAAYWAIQAPRARVWLLVIASFVFYASWSQWLALLVVGFACLDYLLGRAIAAAVGSHRRALLILGLALNLGLLSYFKYVDFFMDSLETSLHFIGVGASLPTLRLIAPIGLSFYTFEAINYLVDVYRGQLPAERDLARFLLFILFFPHLIAGPIVRARDFLPQIRRRKRWDPARVHLGLQTFLLGLIKKLVIADRMARFADPLFADPSRYASGALWMATVAYALQVYGDFSGYSDMAIGSAHLLGYKLTTNFNLPYLAVNIADFWRRWHISLSNWLREHLFIPLGGSRGGPWRTARNLMLTMTLGGLWHGAAWTYVAWGMLHGILLIGHRVFAAHCSTRPMLKRRLETPPGTVARVALTFTCFCLTLVVFRCVDLTTGATMLGRMLLPCEGAGTPLPARGFWLTVFAVALGHALALRRRWPRLEARLPAPVRGFGYALALVAVLVLAPGAGKAFLYFQF